MSENPIGAISRIPPEVAGVPDAVEMMAQCNVANFKTRGKEVVGIGHQALTNCKLMASFDNEVVTISVRGKHPFAVSVRLDEMMALLKEAADFHKEATAPSIPDGTAGGESPEGEEQGPEGGGG